MTESTVVGVVGVVRYEGVATSVMEWWCVRLRTRDKGGH